MRHRKAAAAIVAGERQSCRGDEANDYELGAVAPHPEPCRQDLGTRPAGPGVAPWTANQPMLSPFDRPAPAKNTSQAKARAKARKAKAPKLVRPTPMERLAARLTSIDLRRARWQTRFRLWCWLSVRSASD